MIVRVRAPNGALRFEVDPNDTAVSLVQQVAERLQVQPTELVLYFDPQFTQFLAPSPSPLSSFNIKHGDQLFAKIAKSATLVDLYPAKTAEAANASSGDSSSQPATPQIVEDEVDILLYKESGQIERKRAHERQMRLQDLPIMPYDEEYLKEHKIKHMSFHAMLRKVMDRHKNSGLAGRITILNDGIDELVRQTHPQPGRMLRVQDMPSTIQLNRQDFRMVDHVEFDNAQTINTFLDGWRLSGAQRVGYLFGTYAPYSEVPLGIKAVVSCIYEPPQQSTRDNVELLDDPHMDLVNKTAAGLGLRCVGVIVSALYDDGTGRGKVKYTRNFDTYFATCVEVFVAARLQLNHRSPSSYADGGTFGSKFVTLIATGDEQGDIHIMPVMASNQAMAMVAADLIVPTVEPGLMQVVESSEGHVVPDVSFSVNNEFGTAVRHLAKPNFPVEYLLVSLTYGIPRDARPMFTTKKPFPIENRLPVEISQLAKHLKEAKDFMDVLSDFHLLLFFVKEHLFELNHDFPALLTAVKERNVQMLEAALQTDSWKTIQLIISS